MARHISCVDVAPDVALHPRQIALEFNGEVGHGPGRTAEAHNGEVFTRKWVVELILDLVGFTPDRDLAALVAVEPSCGAGAFLGPMTERIVVSCERHGRPIGDASQSVRAFDLLPQNVERARALVAATLQSSGVSAKIAATLARTWVGEADFLLSEHHQASVDFVIGNPPYVRLENLPATRSARYRAACPTMRGRSDLFVGFLEIGLRLLRLGGVLGFIVADRWMRNEYGAAVREMIAKQFAMENVLVMHDVDAFEDRVSAYPAITVIRRAPQGEAVVAEATAGFGPAQADRFVAWARSRIGELRTRELEAARIPKWFGGRSSWPAGRPAELALVAELEGRFPPLEDPRTETRVGIGVATGADGVFLTRDASLVEEDRLLPLLMTRDTVGGTARWSGTYLLNPWDDGRLVDLDHFPRLSEYLHANGPAVRARHVARRRPDRWYRTIDRVDPTLLKKRKLVIPDLKGFIHPVLEEGRSYPHHALYHVTSAVWDMEVLGGLLLSKVAELFVATYCVRMRGGCYRFQAQYLRRIRVPSPASLSRHQKSALAKAFADRDVEAASAVAMHLYEIDRSAPGARRLMGAAA